MLPLEETDKLRSRLTIEKRGCVLGKNKDFLLGKLHWQRVQSKL